MSPDIAFGNGSAAEPISPSADICYFGERSSAPTDSDYEAGQVALWFDDSNPPVLMKRPHGGTATQVGGSGGGGSAVAVDLGDDGSAETTDLQEIAITGDSDSVFSVASDVLTVDVSQPWAGGVSDGTITEAMLNAANSPSSGYVLAWNGSQLEWQIDSTGGSSSIEAQNDGTTLTSDMASVNWQTGVTATAGTDDVAVNVEEGEVDHDALLNYVANEHVDHSSVSVTGTGSLTGGGDLTSSRSLDVADGGIDTTELADASVTEAKLNAADAPSSGEVLTWNGSQLEWQADDTGGGSAVILDLADDGTNESTDLQEIAIQNDTNTIFSEPSADKLLIDVGVNWPTADTVADGAITEPKLNAADAPSSGEVLTWNGSQLEWQADDSGAFTRVDVTSASTTLSVGDSAWVDTAAAGGAVTATLPASPSDGDRVEVGVEDATNDTTVAANTGQSILGAPTTLTTQAETITLEYKSSSSTWMIR